MKKDGKKQKSKFVIIDEANQVLGPALNEETENEIKRQWTQKGYAVLRMGAKQYILSKPTRRSIRQTLDDFNSNSQKE